MDQCKHCTVRGDFDKCRQIPCSHRENWGFREAVEQAHMAGQMAAGCKHPGYSNARAYFDHTHNDKISDGGEAKNSAPFPSAVVVFAAPTVLCDLCGKPLDPEEAPLGVCSDCYNPDCGGSCKI